MINTLNYHKHINYISFFLKGMLSASLFAQLQKSLPPVVADTGVSAMKHRTCRNHSRAVVQNTDRFVKVSCILV